MEIIAAYEEALVLIDSNALEALNKFDKLIEQGQQLGNDRIKAFSLYKKAHCQRLLKNSDNEMECLLACILYFKTNKDSQVLYDICNSLGRIYSNNGFYAEALEYLLQGLETAKREELELLQIRSYNNLGLLYGRLFNYDESILNFMAALDIFKTKKIVDNVQLMKTNIYLGNTYNRMRLYDRASDHLTTAYGLLNNDASINDKIMPLRGMAYLYLEQGYLEKGKLFLDKINDLFELATNEISVFSYLNYQLLLADYFKRIGNLPTSIDTLIKANAKAKELNVVILQIQIVDALYKLFELTGSYQQALIYYKELNVLKELNHNELNSFHIKQIEAKYHLSDADNARRIAEEAVQMKERILLNMSHEIFTPMNSINGFVQLLAYTKLDEKQADYVEVIKSSSEILIEIVNDLVQLTKINNNKVIIERKNFDLKKIISSLIKIVGLKAEQRKIKINFNYDSNIPEIIRGDYHNLEQILINLLNNAIKFCSDKDIELSVKYFGFSNGYHKIQFAVKDFGIGIPKHWLPTIFESFNIASTVTNKQYGGTGLGLNISYKLTKLMNGNIRVTSEEGVGSTFYLDLPFEIQNKNESQSKLSVTTELDGAEYLKLRKLKVLIVDDNAFNTKLVLHSLKLVLPNVEVFLAENGKEAIDIIMEHQFDVILMDLQMPVLNGYEATRFIRTNLPKEKRNVPIIALTANVIKSEIDKCFELGMNDYLAKPFNIRNLIDKIVTQVA
jgi:signal transduction histidine kinase/ActR/RegA family two-component response regulator